MSNVANSEDEFGAVSASGPSSRPVTGGKRPRKQRQPISCTECRHRKLKCDRQVPHCSACIRRKIPLGGCRFGDERDYETPEQREARVQKQADGEKRRARRKALKASRQAGGEQRVSGGSVDGSFDSYAHPHADDMGGSSDESDGNTDVDQTNYDQKRFRPNPNPSTNPTSVTPLPAPTVPSAHSEQQQQQQQSSALPVPSTFTPPPLPQSASIPSAAAHAQLAVQARTQAARLAAQMRYSPRSQSSQLTTPMTPYASSGTHSDPSSPALPSHSASGLHALISALDANGKHHAQPYSHAFGTITPTGHSHPSTPPNLSSSSPHMHSIISGSQQHGAPSPRRAALPAVAIVAEAAQLIRARSHSESQAAHEQAHARLYNSKNQHTTELLDTLGNQDTTSAVLGLQRLYHEGRQDSDLSKSKDGAATKQSSTSAPQKSEPGEREGDRDDQGSVGGSVEPKPTSGERPDTVPISEEASFARNDVAEHNQSGRTDQGGALGQETAARPGERGRALTRTPSSSAPSTHQSELGGPPHGRTRSGLGAGLGRDTDGNASALLAIGERVLQKSSLNEATAKTRALALLPGKPQTVQLINMYLEELGMITPFVRVDFVMKELDLLYDSVAGCFGSKGANRLPTIAESGPGGVLRQRLIDADDAATPSTSRPRPAAVVQPVAGTVPGAGEPQPRLTFLAYVLFALSAIVELLPSTTIISFNLVRSSDQISTLLHDWLETALVCLDANELAAHPSLEGVQAALVAVNSLAHRFRHTDLLHLLDGSFRAARRLGLDKLGSAVDTPPCTGQTAEGNPLGSRPDFERGIGAVPGPAPRPDLAQTLDSANRKVTHWWVDPDAQMSIDNLEIGRAVWTALTMTDWAHSGLNGSYAIHPGSYTTCPPYAPARWEHSARGMPSPHDAWLGLLETADTARQVVDLTIQAEVTGEDVDYQEVLKLDTKLHEVLSSRTWTNRETDLTFGQEGLRQNLDIQRLQKQASLIRATVHYRTLKLHRPFMSKGYRHPDKPFVASVPRALESARQLVIEARLMSANGWISRRDRIQRYYLFQACLTMITDLWYRPRTFYPIGSSTGARATLSGTGTAASTGTAAPAGMGIDLNGAEASQNGSHLQAGTNTSTAHSPGMSVMGFDSPEETREMEDNLTWIIDRLKDQGQAVEGSVLHGASKNLERLISATFQRGLQQQMLRSQGDGASAADSGADDAEGVPPLPQSAALGANGDPAGSLTDHDEATGPPDPHTLTHPPIGGFHVAAADGMLLAPRSSPPTMGADDEIAQLMDIQLSRLAAMTPQTNMLNINLAHPHAGLQLGGLPPGSLNALAALSGVGGLSSSMNGQLDPLGLLSQLPGNALSGLYMLQQQLQSSTTAFNGNNSNNGASGEVSNFATPNGHPTTQEWPGPVPSAPSASPLPSSTTAFPPTSGQAPGSHELMQYFLSSGGGDGGNQSDALPTESSQPPDATPSRGATDSLTASRPPPAPMPAPPSSAASALNPSSNSGAGAALLQPMFPPQVDWVSAWSDLWDTMSRTN